MYFATFVEVLHQQHKDSLPTDLSKEPILLILKSSSGIKIKHGFHIKSVGPTSCVETLRSWSYGKDEHLIFGIPMIWREQIDHVADLYFWMVNVKDFNKKNKQLLQYPNFNLALSPVQHVVDASKSVFNCLPNREEDDTLRYSSTSTDDDMSVDSFSKSCCLLPASLFDQSEINDLIHDLHLPKQSSELLASRLQENHVLHPGTNTTFYQNREHDFFQFFSFRYGLLYFRDLESILEVMGLTQKKMKNGDFS